MSKLALCATSDASPTNASNSSALPQPRRLGKYRCYECDDVARLKFVRRARQLGFTVDDVRGLLLLARVDGEPSRAKIDLSWFAGPECPEPKFVAGAR